MGPEGLSIFSRFD